MARDLASRLAITFLVYGAEQTVSNENAYRTPAGTSATNRTLAPTPGYFDISQLVCQLAGLTDVSLQSVKDFLNDPDLIVLITGRTVAGFFIFLAAIVPIYLFAVTIYPSIRGVLPSQSESCQILKKDTFDTI